MTQEYLNKIVDLGDPDFVQVFDESSLWSAYFGRLLLENLPLKKGLHVLDVGCGTGFPLIEIANQMGPSSKLIGIDIWEHALDRANFKKKYYNLKNVEIIKADASDLPFEDRRFDLITSNLGINNFEKPQKALNECSRVLKPNGEMIITTNTVGHMRLFYSVYEEVLKNLERSSLIPQLQNQEAHRKTAGEIMDMFKKSGFQIVKTINDSLTLRYLDGTAFLRHSLTVCGFLEGWRNILKKEDEVIVFKKLEEKLNEIAAIEGELRMNIPMLFIHAKKS
jgi:ubiquinone/menaquinone biosynthesis C-methylase UbiE